MFCNLVVIFFYISEDFYIFSKYLIKITIINIFNCFLIY